MRLRSLAAALLVVPGAAAAQLPCAAGPLAAYLGLGAGGCTVGGVTVRAFGVRAVSGGGAPYTGEVTLTPFARAEGPGTVAGFTVAFTPGLAAARPFVGRTAPESFFQQVGVSFTADAAPGHLLGGVRFVDLVGRAAASRALEFPNRGEAVVEGGLRLGPLTVLGRGYDWCGGVPCFAVGRADFARGSELASGFVELIGTAEVVGPNGLTLVEPVMYEAAVASFSAGVWAAPAATFVPEPSTLALAAAGGLALAGAAHRRRRQGPRSTRR